MFSIKQDKCGVHWCRKWSFHELTSVTALSGWVFVWRQLYYHQRYYFTPVLSLSVPFLPISVGLLLISKTIITTYATTAKSHTELHYSPKPYMILLIILSQVHLSGITGLMSSLCSIATNILGSCVINPNFYPNKIIFSIYVFPQISISNYFQTIIKE